MNNIKFMAMAAIAACTLASCGEKDKAKETDKAKEIPQVKIADVIEDDIAQTEVYTATVESDVKNNISPNVPYRIEKIYVEVGDQVRKGQVLVQLDQSSLRQLKLQIDNQQIEFNRVEALYKVGGASKAEYDNMKMNLDVLQTQYRQMVQNTQLLSPISGVVTARNYDNGDMYTNTPILTVEQTNPVKLIVNVSENYYKLVKKGQSVDITLDAYEGENFTGKVTIV
ncbi:MAG: efflux RND transporter periplasmic adaptor subunit, partial [Bacteroidaceae bacterium]|nr:efflux RND transporter periplasmic adaptor subunit [Bacteroidaceae bacterium]